MLKEVSKFQPNTMRIPMGLLLDVFKTCQGLKIYQDSHFVTDDVQDTYWGGALFDSWLGYRLSSYVLWFYLSFLTDFGFIPWLTSGHAVAQLVEALRYKLEGRRFNSR
jgi:hypothetical protein